MERTDSRSRPRSSPRRRLSLLAVSGLAIPFVLWVEARAQQPSADASLVFEDLGTQRFAIPDCIPKSGDEASREACRTLTQVLKSDLQFENLFKFVPDNLLAAIPPLNPDNPNMIDFGGINASILVVTRAQATGSDLSVEMKVIFVKSGRVMLAKRYSGKADNPRVFAHQASDDIMTLTQYRGVARTKIAFTSDRDAQANRRTKEIYIMDYDGFNPRRVTVNRSLNLLPAWSPDGRSLAYVSYRQGGPEVFLAHIYEGRSQSLTSGKDGQAFAPAFSPDGKRIAYASSRGGNMEIWVANADGTGARRLTSSPGLDTAPFWSPTGNEIAFTSDRSGTPQIYAMDSEGLNVRRVTTVGNWNDAPAWSPSKQWSEIAYTSRLDGGFEIAVKNLESGEVRQITQGQGSCEYPTWAPSGRHLAFACRRGGKWQVAVADRLGQRVQLLPAGAGNNVYPDWGP